jgi:hypothetical protein
MERWCNNIFYPALLILLSNNPGGELQCNVSNVNIWTHSHWEFVSEKINEIK